MVAKKYFIPGYSDQDKTVARMPTSLRTNTKNIDNPPSEEGFSARSESSSISSFLEG